MKRMIVLDQYLVVFIATMSPVLSATSEREGVFS